jgi:hypothetical protein
VTDAPPPARAPGPPEDTGAAPRGIPGDERGPEADGDLERSRRLRRFSAWAQAGGAAFLAVVSLGLLPAILSAAYPAAGERLAVAVWVAAPAIPIALLVVAAFRLPR